MGRGASNGFPALHGGMAMFDQVALDLFGLLFGVVVAGAFIIGLKVGNS